MNRQLTVECLDYEVNIKNNPTIKSAKLVYVNGKGALKTYTRSAYDLCYGTRYFSHVRLNDIPLVQINSPGCPTCASLLATGHGIENANCEEIKSIRDRINAPFVSLENSISDLTPVLTLLESGLYVIADAICFPTDGNGNFFWNTSNQFEENPATAALVRPELDYNYVAGQPIYLYPTQDTDFYNEERVNHYMELLEDEQHSPRAIVYNIGEFINIVLDGHHKACAASLLKKPLNCILIIPCSETTYEQIGGIFEPSKMRFSSIEISKKHIPIKYRPLDRLKLKRPVYLPMSKGIINHRKWEEKYINSADKFLSLIEYGEIIAADIPHNIEDEFIESCLLSPNKENQQKLKAILFVMKQQADSRLKYTAISCATKVPKSDVAVLAYRILSHMKKDPEIEQLFVDYLIECDDKYDAVLPIIDSYWE